MTINDLGELLKTIIFLWVMVLLFNHTSRWRRLIGWGMLVVASIYLVLNFAHVQGTLTTVTFQNAQVLLGIGLVAYILITMYLTVFKSKT